jgi:hypothetical protein
MSKIAESLKVVLQKIDQCVSQRPKVCRFHQ